MKFLISPSQVVFGTVVTRGPRSPLAQSAMAELEQACVLFQKASTYSIRATKALVCIVCPYISIYAHAQTFPARLDKTQ